MFNSYLKAANQNDTSAQFHLGVLYQNGQGVPQSFEQAAAWFLKAANQNHAIAQCNLGVLYQNGQGVPQSFEQAAAWYLKAANQNHAIAQYNLGVLYESGQGVPQSFEQAAAWFLKAANQNDDIAQYNLGVLYKNGQGVPQSFEQAAAWFLKAANQNYAIAQTNLGLLYKNGQGVPQSFEQAAAWFLKAANQNYAIAQFNLGVLYQNGQGVPQSFEQAAAWSLKAANQNYAIAQTNLGFLYYHSQGVPQSFEQAAAWYLKAANQNYAIAQTNLGLLYKNGQGVPQSFEQAAAWFLKAANQNEASAQTTLGLLYQNGQGVPQSFEQAAAWFLKAANQNYAIAQFNLGVLYQNGQGVPQSFEQAAAWSLKAANQNYAIAQTNLGFLYYHSQGVPQSFEQAAAWYLKAANQNYAIAQYNLGLLYKNGQGVPQSFEQAAAWFLKAANQNEASAQTTLGLLYQNGQGVPQSFEQAAAWFLKAANQNYANAQTNLGLLYKNGQGVPQSFEQAAAWFLKAANQNEASAQTTLGVLYQNGQGVPQSFEQAAAWFLKAANQNYAIAQNNLGLLYKNGQGVPQSFEQAAAWSLKAANQNYAIAQTNLGFLYYHSQGVPQSFEQAAAWYLKAANQNYAIAQYNLGLLYKNGQGVPQSFEQAAAWFLKAANQNYAIAQCTLGILHENGQGVPQSFEQAAAWYLKAAKQENIEAQRRLERLQDKHKELNPGLSSQSIPVLKGKQSDYDNLFPHQEFAEKPQAKGKEPLVSSRLNTPTSKDSKFAPLSIANSETSSSNQSQSEKAQQRKHDSIIESIQEECWDSISRSSWGRHKIDELGARMSKVERSIDSLYEWQEQTDTLLEVQKKRHANLTYISQFAHAKEFYLQLFQKLFAVLNAYSLIATGKIKTPTTSTFRGLDALLTFIEPVKEIIRLITEGVLYDAEVSSEKSKGSRYSVATDTGELSIVVEHIALEIACLYREKLKNLPYAEIEIASDYAVRQILECIWEAGGKAREIDYVNNPQAIFPEKIRMMNFLNVAGWALIVGEPENKAPTTLQGDFLEALEKLDEMAQWTRPINIIRKIHALYVNHFKKITITPGCKIPLKYIFKDAICTEDGVILHPFYQKEENKPLLEALTRLNCATRPALFSCDSIEILEEHGWKLQPIPQSDNEIKNGASQSSQDIEQQVKALREDVDKFKRQHNFSQSSFFDSNVGGSNGLLHASRYSQNASSIYESSNVFYQSTHCPELPEGLTYKAIVKKGRCLFHAVALHLKEDVMELRNLVAQYMQKNLAQLETCYAKTKAELITQIKAIKQGEEYGDTLEIEMLQKTTARAIIIVQTDGDPIIPKDSDEYSEPPVFICYDPKRRHYDGLILRPDTNPQDILDYIEARLTLQLPVTSKIAPKSMAAVELEEIRKTVDALKEITELQRLQNKELKAELKKIKHAKNPPQEQKSCSIM